MFKRLAIVLAWLLLSSSPEISEAIPAVTAGSAIVTIGDTFTLPVSITDAVDLSSFQFDLAFDPLFLQANTAGATPGAFLPGDWFFTSPGTVDNTNGQILGVSAFGSAVSGSGVLANFEFTAIGVGISPITLSNVFLNFSDQDFLVVNGEVVVNPVVPEPSTLALLSLGLGALGVRQWRRQRT